MIMYSFAVHTLGCKVNQYETEVMTKDLLECGFELVDFSQRADVYVINTCTVTGTSDHKSRKYISKALRKNPSAIVAVTGCYAERVKEELKSMSGIDLVLGNRAKGKMAERIARKLQIEQNRQGILSHAQHFHTRALVKAQDGCDNFCSYCIVPYVRGAPRSRSLKEVRAEISALAQSGVKEVVLTGINLGKYGQDLEAKLKFVDLLKATDGIARLVRIRLSSIEVKDLTAEVIAFLSSSPRFCRHLHIPLQSGDDCILKSMNRDYTADEYLRLVKEIRKMMPNIVLTTDVMVGFPGETEEQFKKTKLMVKKSAFSKVHVFKYSDRAGTSASGFSKKVDYETKNRRSKELIDLGKNLAEACLDKFVGKKMDVLVEKKAPDGYLVGLTDNYIRIYFAGSKDLEGSIVQVLAEKREGQSLRGRIV